VNGKARRLLKQRSKIEKMTTAQAIERMSPSQSSNEANTTVDTMCSMKNDENEM
jgi:hypothetical protein